jgi:hypothetical protein
MMKNLILPFCILFGSLLSMNSYAQAVYHPSADAKQNILYIVKQSKDNKKIISFHLEDIRIDIANVININIIPKDSIASKYLNMGAETICEMTLDPYTVLINYKDLLSKRHIPVAKRKLPVYFNQTLVDSKRDLWLNEKDIKKIVIENSKIVITSKK